MNKTLRLEFVDANGKKCSISISDPKDNVTKIDASEFGTYLVNEKIVAAKDAALESYQKAFLVTRQEIELV
ncbi:DUF2922 domain-containing protein [Peptoniphilus raoultii]|uniref:DUF2922 domain-containing protein n=1 Tax=Peptoniphilus raoultii TaxID=1776387 RepID=UPI0008DA4231|nr:DUF2922 domain-containing protein [Peptoniphilus raoultii]